MSAASAERVQACPQCGLDCRLVAMTEGCGLGRSAIPADAPAAMIDGQVVSVDAAVERAAAILAVARYPLIYGLAHSTVDAQRAAVRLADRLGACIDVAGASASALFPDIGVVTCTLGEVKNRADLIVFWGGRPHESHPRLCRKFAVDPPGLFLPHGRQDRTIIVVGDRATADALKAGFFLPCRPGGEFAALWLLRALVQSRAIDSSIASVAGVSLADWLSLADELKRCRYGVLFLDPGPADKRAIEVAHGLATDLYAFTRFHVIGLPGPGNTLGAENVLTWQTGFPSAVGLHCGHPRSCGSEYGGNRLLERGEADAALLIGLSSVEQLSAKGQSHLLSIPSIALSAQIASLPMPATVAITASACADRPGATAFRFDGLALPLPCPTSPSFPDEYQLLIRIEESFRRMAEPA